MNDRRKLHPVYVVFALLQTIKGLIPLAVLTLLRGADWMNMYWYAGFGAAVVLLILYGFFDWRNYTYALANDRIVIRKGVLFRDEKTIYFGKIHSVNIEQPFVQRILGVAQLKIETPGGNKKADGILSALSVKDAEQLRVQLLNRKGKAETDESVLSGNPAADAQPKMHTQAAVPAVAEASSPSYRLHGGQLLLAALTSMNFGLVAAFVAGLYSFADDVIELIAPDHFYENIAKESVSLLPSGAAIVLLAAGALIVAWLLSMLLFFVKFAGFEVKKEGRRVSISYGLLDKKTHVFDPRKVQAVLVQENVLRQLAGYAQIQLQVVSSDKNEKLCLHPFIPIARLQEVLDEFVPQIKAHSVAAQAPARALLYYMRFWLIAVLAACAATIAFFQLAGLWSLLLLPLVFWWRISCFRAAGMRLEDGQLTLRNRIFSRTTYFTRRPQIVAMKVKRSNGQERRRLLTIAVHAMGSAQHFNVKCLDSGDVEPVWNWYRRN
ncbi:PH domain-containing protein [Paenibacillus sp. NEAU-GSW1]|uniref:PH domain-containing protein n=1 Tax=Paenibacillus sp. NEAU-GSW1 TaxID=2682486 RepID=UPI0012E1E25F|nr:PH domain-containing protein [Paenibacillus sp. NEAU-GSW1]MUT68629.1 PH domain-containing protein [Paenibacillus sp. NEAU-GSW1]